MTEAMPQRASNLYGGWHYENLLGVEWVMPTGDLFRIGSLGSGCGWFCGEGPGPSMKGVARGSLGAKGAMGVFTKCAIKLFAWPGPESLPVEGTVPAYRVSLPDNFRAYTVSFPSWKAWADAAYMIWDTGIGYLAHRQFDMFGRDLKYAMVKILTDPSKSMASPRSTGSSPAGSGCKGETKAVLSNSSCWGDEAGVTTCCSQYWQCRCGCWAMVRGVSEP
jgi:hypothetical protein